ncbi:MAG: 4-demethylwyosine synthase TYW1 [Candidatus Woesearchaeota archaeon]
MLSEKYKKQLEHQGYSIVGDHSAVKTCGWTKSMIRGHGGCYKLTFYGIMSHQCMQMSTSLSCANRCTFCWRGYKAPVSKGWKWKTDDPVFIVNESKKAHHKQLTGFGGSQSARKALYKGSKTIKHVALSLTGEPLQYPRMNESIDEFHRQGISTFLVTNAQFPEELEQLKPVTQLYLSIDAPNEQLLKIVDVPLFSDFWQRQQACLDILAKKPSRTTIRLTIIKGINDTDLPGYASLINRGDPDFIEVKGYMHIGESQLRLERKHMPMHEEVVAFSQALEKYLPEYELVTEHVPSSVVLFAKKRFKKNGEWYTWIDFDKFFTLAQESTPPNADDYIRKTPKVGFSGKTTQDYFQTVIKRKELQKKKN